MAHIPSIELAVWKEFEANEITHSAAHHLQAIEKVGREYGGWARVSDIAQELSITRGSVSINLRALTARGLVEQGEHHLLRLTPQGKRIVAAIHAKRILVQRFFCDVLGVDANQAEIDSCKIEHLLSNLTARQLLRFLHFIYSDDEMAVEAMKRLRRFKDRCPDSQACPICRAAAEAAGKANEPVSLSDQLQTVTKTSHETTKQRATH